MQQDDELEWWHLALCQGMNDLRPGEEPHQHPDNFAEEYENDEYLAMTMDSICLSCPVRLMCRDEAIRNNEYGLWGGIFFTNGKIDTARNAHKSDTIWEIVLEGIDG